MSLSFNARIVYAVLVEKGKSMSWGELQKAIRENWNIFFDCESIPAEEHRKKGYTHFDAGMHDLDKALIELRQKGLAFLCGERWRASEVAACGV